MRFRLSCLQLSHAHLLLLHDGRNRSHRHLMHALQLKRDDAATISQMWLPALPPSPPWLVLRAATDHHCWLAQRCWRAPR